MGIEVPILIYILFLYYEGTAALPIWVGMGMRRRCFPLFFCLGGNTTGRLGKWETRVNDGSDGREGGRDESDSYKLMLGWMDIALVDKGSGCLPI